MYPRFHSLACDANLSSNAFKNLGGPIQNVGAGAGGGSCADTTLRLDSISPSALSISSSKGMKRKWSLIDGSINQQTGSSLCLHLGHSSSSSDSKGSSATRCTSTSSAKETDEESSMDLELDFTLHLGNEKSLSLKKSAAISEEGLVVLPKVDLELSLSSARAESEITTVHPSSSSLQTAVNVPQTTCETFQLGQGSVSSWRNGNLHSSFNISHSIGTSFFLNQDSRQIMPTPVSPNQSPSVITNSKSSVTCTSGVTKQQLQQQQRSNSTKQCQFQGCIKGARGASGLCIAHGGGRRCQKHGCLKGAEGRTAFCKAHGGGRRCEFLGCTKSAEGRTDFCIAHGGGRRCSHGGCTRAARGKSGLCIRHGGGKRCQKENCTKSAEGLSGMCISHGGGRRCQYPQCTKGAQGSTMFCKAHGGGKRCTFEGCTKGAEGSTPYCKGHGGGKRCSFQGGICTKSVHGGTLFCVAHGGGKRCAVPECTKSARGRTDYCVRHGGGRRCQFEGCGKSAQGSTDFCKSHGGGKRCYWGQPGSEFGKGKTPCNSFARGKKGLCASHGALVQDKRVHGGATLGVVVHQITPNEIEIVTSEDTDADLMNVEASAVTSANGSDWNYFGFKQATTPIIGSHSSVPVTVPEGRVHGGSLMSMLATSSEPGKAYITHQSWI